MGGWGGRGGSGRLLLLEEEGLGSEFEHSLCVRESGEGRVYISRFKTPPASGRSDEYADGWGYTGAWWC